jgi:hypothetical protein
LPDQELKVRANIKFIERAAKPVDRWNLVKELSQRMTEVHDTGY